MDIKHYYIEKGDGFGRLILNGANMKQEVTR